MSCICRLWFSGCSHRCLVLGIAFLPGTSDARPFGEKPAVMFDLNKSIANWRRQMSAAGIKNSEVLDELESHLREDIEQRICAGTAWEQALNAAIKQIGRPATLKA